MPSKIKDKKFKVKVRRQGNVKAGQISIALTLPLDLAREITKGKTNQEVWDILKDYEFKVELVPEGILFKPFKLTVIEGW